MSALRAAAAALAMTCSLALGATAASARPSPSPMVDQINVVRKAYGLRTLNYSPTLARSSSTFVHQLMRAGRFSHAARISASSRFAKLGEILALTPSWQIDRTRTIIQWLISPSHRAVLLSRSFRYIGAARTQGYLAGREAVLWAVRFGKLKRHPGR